MNGFIIGIEIDLRLIHFLSREDFLKDCHHIAQHLVLPGLATDIHQEDKNLLRGDFIVYAT